MRLFLASYRFGAFAKALAALVGPARRVAVVSNALDFIEPAARDAYARTVYDQLAAFDDLGLTAFDLDLRNYFGGAPGLEEDLDGVGLVFATGGNSFLLRQAMRLSGFDTLIPRLLAEDRLAYGGYSAGAIVAGPTLHGVELMDAPDETAPGYPAGGPIWEGLGFHDQIIVPHFRSGHHEGPAAEAMAARLQAEGAPFVTLGDSDVIVSDVAGTLVLRG